MAVYLAKDRTKDGRTKASKADASWAADPKFNGINTRKATRATDGTEPTGLCIIGTPLYPRPAMMTFPSTKDVSGNED